MRLHWEILSLRNDKALCIKRGGEGRESLSSNEGEGSSVCLGTERGFFLCPALITFTGVWALSRVGLLKPSTAISVNGTGLRTDRRERRSKS